MESRTHPVSHAERTQAVSVIVKVATLFIILTLCCGAFLLVNSYLSKRMVGIGSAINHAGSERMRIYRLASLVLQLEDGPKSGLVRAAVHRETEEWERVLEGLEYDTAANGSVVSSNPQILSQVNDIQARWTRDLKPSVERVLQSSARDRGREAETFLQHAHKFVGSLSKLVDALEQHSATQVTMLYQLQIVFLVFAASLLVFGIVLIHRWIRRPLATLVAGAERLARGELGTTISVGSGDEFGQLARTFERMAGTIRQKIDAMKALHTTGQEISTLDPGGLDPVLRRIVDRAADLLNVDLAVIMARHAGMECWVVEAASGVWFDATRREILLLEEAPFCNQAFEGRTPVKVDDLDLHKHMAVRFRDEFGAKSLMAVPLIGPHEEVGVLVLLTKGLVRPFTEWDISLAEQLASYVAVTMENARFYEAVETESQSLRDKLEAVGQKVAELTHEVKGPAGRAAEFAAWLEEDYGDRLDGKALRYLDWIKREGKHLSQLAERTLDLEQMNRLRTPVESVDAEEVVHEVLSLLGHELSSIRVEAVVADDLPRFACRRIHVKQILENLISNALKYLGPQPQPKIEIGVQKSEEGTLLYVRDNGVGIDKEMLGRIFVPFQRLGAVEAPGVGIGLTIVKTIVEQYGGAVTVKSEPCMGSTFYVRLPMLSGKAASRGVDHQEGIPA